jgi:tetratricopeptide (TPR) repeat protein
MKIGLVLIRKQADIYRSQGLHQEARELYSKFSACSTQIDPNTKVIIEKQLQLIDLEMSCVDTAAPQELSGDEIEIIKKGWGEAASGVDILVCAQAFMDIGRYGDALKEFKTLILNGSDHKHLVYSITECFLQLFNAQGLPSEADQYAKSIFEDSDAILKLQIAIAVQLLKRSKLDHALELYRHLSAKDSSSKKIQTRLTALSTMIQIQLALQAASPENMKFPEAAPNRKSGPFHLSSKFKSVCSKIFRSF